MMSTLRILRIVRVLRVPRMCILMRKIKLWGSANFFDVPEALELLEASE